MDRVPFLGQLLLLTFAEGVLADPLGIGFAARVDEDIIRLAKRDRVGDLQQRFFVLDRSELREVVRVELVLDDGLCLVDGRHAAGIGEDVHTLFELQHVFSLFLSVAS